MSLLPSRKRQEWHPLASLQGEMNRLFEDFFGGRPLMRGFWGDHQESFMPAVDVRETDDKVILEAELPGMDPKEVDIKLEGDLLTISGERKVEKEEKTKSYHRVERSYGNFQREIELPHGVDQDRIDATFKNGVLTIEIAKKEEAKPKTIQVKARS